MGSLYHLGQKLVDFANIITRHANRNDTVPSSSLVYKGAKNIATIEDSNVASKAYSVGEFLILDGQLYRVTNAIASGGTITVGTNVTLDSVGSEIKSLNDSLVNSIASCAKSVRSVTVRIQGTNYSNHSISAYSHYDASFDLTAYGAPDGYSFTGYSVLTEINANLIVTMHSVTGNTVTFRIFNPTNGSQTTNSIVSILKFLTY